MKKYEEPKAKVFALQADETIAALDHLTSGDGDGLDFEDM